MSKQRIVRPVRFGYHKPHYDGCFGARSCSSQPFSAADNHCVSSLPRGLPACAESHTRTRLNPREACVSTDVAEKPALDPARSEPADGQLWVSPLPTGGFTKLEEQGTPSAGAWLRDVRSVFKIPSGFPEGLNILQGGTNSCLAGAVSCAAASYRLRACRPPPGFVLLLPEEVYSRSQTIPAHRNLVHEFIICQLCPPSSTPRLIQSVQQKSVSR